MNFIDFDYEFHYIIYIISIEPQTDVSHVRVHEMTACMCLYYYLHHISFVYKKKVFSVCNTVLLTDCFSIDAQCNVQITIKNDFIKEKVLTYPMVVTITTT